jgi:hypothetical protein
MKNPYPQDVILRKPPLLLAYMRSLGCFHLEPPRRCRGEPGKADQAPTRALHMPSGERDASPSKTKNTPGSLRSLGSLFTSGRRAGRCGRSGRDSAYRQEKGRLCDGAGWRKATSGFAIPASNRALHVTQAPQRIAGSQPGSCPWAGTKRAGLFTPSSCFGRFRFRQVPSIEGPANSAPLET